MNKKKEEKKSQSNTLLLIQFILLIILLLVIVASIYIKELDGIKNLLFSLLFAIIAYNNHKIYKRNYFTFLYAFVSVIYLIIMVLNIYG